MVSKKTKTFLGVGAVVGAVLLLSGGQKERTLSGGGGGFFGFPSGLESGINLSPPVIFEQGDIIVEAEKIPSNFAENTSTPGSGGGGSSTTSLGFKEFRDDSGKIIGIEDPFLKVSRLPTAGEQFLNKAQITPQNQGSIRPSRENRGNFNSFNKLLRAVFF